MSDVLSPGKIAAALTELWSPRVIAELDDSFVKVAKVHGSLAWHSHDDEDELFFILAVRSASRWTVEPSCSGKAKRS